MTTVLFSGAAVIALLLTTEQANASDSLQLSSQMRIANQSNARGAIKHGHFRFHPRPGFHGIPTPSYNMGPDRTGDYREPEYGPSMRADISAYQWNDEVAFAAPDGSSYSYDGEWDGEYVDPNGRVFEGEWSGTVTRQDGQDVPGYPAPRPSNALDPASTFESERHHGGGYHVPHGYEGYERCLKSNGITGGAIGSILGAIAGNRIAGRGDRLGGTLLGAGLGGLAGMGIEKAMNSCKRHRPGYFERSQGHYQPQHHGNQHLQGGYYYYPQTPVVTVTVLPGASYTTTTVTEEITYETLKSHPRKRAVRKWRQKPRCVCR